MRDALEAGDTAMRQNRYRRRRGHSMAPELTIRLARPVTHEGRTYEALSLRRPGPRDFDQAAKQPSFTSREAALVAMCCRVPFAVIANIDVADYRAIVAKGRCLRSRIERAVAQRPLPNCAPWLIPHKVKVLLTAEAGRLRRGLQSAAQSSQRLGNAFKTTAGKGNRMADQARAASVRTGQAIGGSVDKVARPRTSIRHRRGENPAPWPGRPRSAGERVEGAAARSHRRGRAPGRCVRSRRSKARSARS